MCWLLTHCCLLTHVASEILVKSGSGNGLLPDNTNSLPIPILTGHQQDPLAFIPMFTWILKISICVLFFKFTHLNSQPHLSGYNELMVIFIPMYTMRRMKPFIKLCLKFALNSHRNWNIITTSKTTEAFPPASSFCLISLFIMQMCIWYRFISMWSN